MQKLVSKTLIGATLALGLLTIANMADAYQYQSCRWVPRFYGPNGSWYSGHRECVNSSYSVDRCGWVPGHFVSYGWIPGHRACWW